MPNTVSEAVGTIGNMLTYMQAQHESQRASIHHLEIELVQARAEIETLQEGSSSALQSAYEELHVLKDDVSLIFKKFGDCFK